MTIAIVLPSLTIPICTINDEVRHAVLNLLFYPLSAQNHNQKTKIDEADLKLKSSLEKILCDILN